MIIDINSGAVKLLPTGNVPLPDYGQRKLEVIETIELEKVVVDSGGSLVGSDFSVAGVLTQAALATLAALTDAAIGVYSDVPVDIKNNAGVTLWSGNAWPTKTTNVTLLGGQVLFADATTGFIAGDTLASATVQLKFKG